jgi:hypothetical protein
MPSESGAMSLETTLGHVIEVEEMRDVIIQALRGPVIRASA